MILAGPRAQHGYGFQAILNNVQEDQSELPQPLITIETLMNYFDTISITNLYHSLLATHFSKDGVVVAPTLTHISQRKSLRKAKIIKANVKGTIPHPNDEINLAMHSPLRNL